MLLLLPLLLMVLFAQSTIVDFVMLFDVLVGLDSWYVCMNHNYAKYASETSRRMMMSS